MAWEQGRTVDAQIGALFKDGVTGGLTDGQLLERFNTRRGDAAEGAFAALVERHGSLVLGACRKILHDDHEAEDAFQATFLVLAFKGKSLWVRDSLGPWLHRVSCRIALRARMSASRREVVHRKAAERAANRADGEGRDVLGRLIHEEVDRLPSHYRVPVVLCDLEGRTHEDAARHLGCPVGTVKSRLARGRQRLRERLTRQGLALPAGLVAIGALAPPASAAVPPLLAASTVHAALRGAAGNLTAGALPATIAALTEGMLTRMFAARMLRYAGITLAAGVVSVAVGMLVQRTAAAPPPDDRPRDASKKALAVAKADRPAPEKPARGGEIVARVADLARTEPGDLSPSMVAIDPETAKWRTIARGLPPGPVSPDGRYIVYSQLGTGRAAGEPGIWIHDTTGETPGRRIFERNGVPHWSHDGKRVVIGVPTADQNFETWSVDVDGKQRQRLPIAETDLVLDCSRDGNWLATRTVAGIPAQRGGLTLVHPDGTGPRHLTKGSPPDDAFAIFQISPDGRSLACVEVKTEERVRRSKVFVMDVEGKHRREIPAAIEPGSFALAKWSPDGSQLALNVTNERTKEGTIALVNLDGTNFRKLALPPGRWNVQVCGWTTLDPRLRAADLDAIAPKEADTPRGRYRALIDEVNRAKPFEPRRYLERFKAIADSAPDDRAAVDALLWVVQYGFDGPIFSGAIDRLAERHAEDPRVRLAAPVLASSMSPSSEKLLLAVIAKNPSRPLKARACLALGRYYKQQAERLRTIKSNSDEAERWETLFAEQASPGESFTVATRQGLTVSGRIVEQGSGRAGFARFLARDPDVLLKKAEATLERAAKEFGDVPHTHGTLGDEARADLFEIRGLSVGKPAPEIAGEDVAGRRFALSEARGKVVVLSFWADWCASCRDRYKHDRSLVTRMQGKPFVLLGINGDGDRDALKALLKTEGITWRSWWDGGGNANALGPITRRYNVSVWPTLYLLDDEGIIRGKYLGTPGKKFDSEIDALVEAAVEKAEAGKTRGPR